MIFKNSKWYNILKWCDICFIPALLTFYGVIGNTLDIPHTDVVLTIGAAFDVFLGTLIGISSNKYNEMNEEHEE